MKILLALLALTAAACVAFEPPVVKAGETVCIVGTCDHLLPILREMESPEFTAAVKAANPGVPRDVPR